MDEKRSEYFLQVFEGNIWIEARQKQTMDRFDRGYVLKVLADNFGNGLSNFFPLYFSIDRAQNLLEGRKIGRVLSPNLSDNAASYLTRICSGADATDVFYHTVAFLHAPKYREENAGALRQDWPRIPLPDSKEALLASAALGRQIAALLDTETPFVAPASGRQASETLALQKIAAFSVAKRNDSR